MKKLLCMKRFGSESEVIHDLDEQFGNYILIASSSPNRRIENRKEWERGVAERVAKLAKQGAIYSYKFV